MKKSLLFIFAAVLALGGVLASHQAAAQTNCPDVKINVSNLNPKSNPVQKQFPNCGKPKSVTLVGSDEIRSCRDFNVKATAVPDWSWDESTKTFKIWLVNNFNAKVCSPGIVSWLVGYTLSWGGVTSAPEPVTTGYYCDRTDPAKPTCQPTTNSQITDTEYQCSLGCQPQSYNLSVASKPEDFDFFETPVGYSYRANEMIDFNAVAQGNNIGNLGCVDWSWDFGDGTKEGGQFCGSSNNRNHTYTQPGVYTVTARAYSNTSANAILHYPGFVGNTEVVIACKKSKGSRTNFNLIVGDLINNQPVKIAANDFKEWTNKNLAKVIMAMGESQCRLIQNETEEAIRRESTKTIKFIKRYTDTNLPYPLTLDKVNLVAGVNQMAHELIAIDVNEIQADKKYQVKVIDPNGPEVKTIICKIQKASVRLLYNDKKINAMFCDLGGDFGLGLPGSTAYDVELIDSLISAKNDYCRNNSQSTFCRERQNLSNWLKNNYTNINNGSLNMFEEAGEGFCWGWTDFNLRVAYLADFVGECEGDKITKDYNWFFQSLAAVTARPWVELLLNFVRQ